MNYTLSKHYMQRNDKSIDVDCAELLAAKIKDYFTVHVLGKTFYSIEEKVIKSNIVEYVDESCRDHYFSITHSYIKQHTILDTPEIILFPSGGLRFYLGKINNMQRKFDNYFIDSAEEDFDVTITRIFDILLNRFEFDKTRSQNQADHLNQASLNGIDRNIQELQDSISKYQKFKDRFNNLVNNNQ